MNRLDRTSRFGRTACAAMLTFALATNPLLAFAGEPSTTENLRGGGHSEPLGVWDEPHFSISAGENADANKDGEGAESATPSTPGETAQIIQQVALDEQPSSNNQGEQPDGTGSATTPDQAGTTTAPSTDQVAGTVPLPAGSAEGITSIVSDNLVFEINTQTTTATLVGSATIAPKGDLSVPASVTSGATIYEVTAIAKNAFANCPELTSVSLPATLREVDPDALAGCPSLKSISVSSKNDTFASSDGMLFTKDYSTLLLIPEGKEGAAAIPGETSSVPAQAFSRCLGIATLRTGDGGAELKAHNGMLFTKDLKTLLVCPAGAGSAVVLPAETEAIGEYALAGCKNLASITALGNMHTIDPTAFADEAKASAVVALPAGEDYEARKAIWEKAGFQHFAEPAQPGATTHPKPNDAEATTSGLTFTLLDDYTLSVDWEGTTDPDANLEIPASAEINGVTYQVSTIAPNAFVNRASLTTVKLPASVTSLGEAAFAGCASLTSVDLPDTLQAINERAFEATALTDIWLPANIATIGPRAFAACESLTRIVALNTPEVADDALAGCANLSIYCPYNGEGTYPWNLGLLANNNHLMPYGLTLPEEPLVLEVGQQANLFENALYEVPEGCEVSYSYAAKTLSVNQNAQVKAKAVGSAKVTVTLTFAGEKIAQAYRAIEVSFMQSKVPITSLRAFNKDISTFRSASDISLLAVGNTFTSADGILTYKVTSESPKEVEVSDCKQAATGSLSIPQIINGYSVTAIGYAAFDRCSKLTSITIPPSVIAIGARAFLYCQFLENLIIPNSVKTIGDSAFSYCLSFESITIPASVTTIGNGAFANTSNLTDITVVSTNSSFSSLDGVLYDKYKTKLICHPALNPGANFAIPSTVTTIDNYAFFESIMLSSVTIPNSVTSIGDWAFRKCSSLRSIDIPNTIKTIGSYAFYGCTSLSSLVIPDSVTSIKNAAFENCSYLSSVTIGIGVTSLPSTVFGGTIKLRDIYLKGNMSSIDDSSFSGVTKSDVKVHLPYGADRTVWINNGFPPSCVLAVFKISFDSREGFPTPSIQSIENGQLVIDPGNPTRTGYHFGGWYRDAQSAAWDFAKDVVPAENFTLYAKWIPLEKVDGDFVYTYLDDATLEVRARDASSITVANIPQSFSFYDQGNLPVSRIQAQGFKGCTKLTSVSIPSSVKSIEASGFEGCSGLTEVTLPSSVTSLGASAFKGCSSLGSVVVPDSVTSLGASAFEGCSKLGSVTFGSGVTALPARVMASCVMLSSVEAKGNVATVASDAFEGVDSSRVSVALTDSSITTSTLSNRKNPWWQLGLTQVSPYLLSFNSQEGSAVASQLAFVNKTVTAPEAPTLAGSIFGGWFDDAEFKSRWNFETDVMPASNKMLYAKWVPESEAEEVDGDLIYRMRPDGTLEVKARNVASITSANIASEHTFAGLGPYPVTAVAADGFKGATNLASVTFKGDNLTTITTSAFEGCTSLVQVRIPASVTAVEASAFSGCTALAGVVFEEGSQLTTIDVSAFESCAFEKIALPKKLTTIGESAFTSCTALSEISLPDSVTSLGQGAFSGCVGLTSLALGAGITTIPANAFNASLNLFSISSTGKVTSIDKNMPFISSIKAKAVVTLGPRDYENHRAVWTDAGFENVVQADTYTLSFDLSGAPGEVPDPQDIKPDEKATAPPDPTWDSSGSTFAGWYEDTDYSLRWDFETSTMPARDVTLHAKWEAPALMSVTAPINPCVVVELGGEIKPSTDTFFQSTGKIGARVSQVSCEVAEGADTLFPKGDATKVGVTVEEIADPANSFSVKPGGAFAFVKGSKPDFSLKGRASQIDPVSTIPVSVGLSIPEGTTMAPDTEASFARLVFTFEPLES